jgi:hypothetical protein
MASRKKNSAFDNVLKTLTAVRATLSPEEQEILDNIVVTRPESEQEGDVEGHRMSSQRVSSSITPPMPRVASTKVASTKVSSTKGLDDEVEGHAMSSNRAASTKVSSTKVASTKVASTKVSSTKGLDDEVEGHAMSSNRAASTKASSTRVASTRVASTRSIFFDVESGEYRVVNTK